MTPRRVLTLAALICATVCLLTSCEKTVFRDHTADHPYTYRSVDARGWLASDTLSFDFPAAAADQADASLSLRLLDSYPYRRLQLSLTVQELHPLRRRFTIHRQVDSQGHTLQADTLSYVVQRIRTLQRQTIDIDLFDEENQPLGSSLPRIRIDHSLGTLPLAPDHRHRILITHRMRDPLLPGITDVGLLLHPSSPTH
jgi:hypothetical protein